MRNIILVILFLMVASLASADVYVAYNQDGSIYGLSEQNDIVLPAGASVKIMKGLSIKELSLAYDLSLYNFNGKDFVVNQSKLSNHRKEQEDIVAEQTKKTNLKDSIKTKLLALGLTEEEIIIILR